MITTLGAGGALVRVPPDNNPNSGGGPIRKGAGSNVAPARAGNFVFRTPHTVVREAEPGAAWEGDLSAFQFDQNGRLRKRQPYAYDMFHGADAPAAVVYTGGVPGGGFLFTLAPIAAMFAGGAVGYNVSSRRGLGTFFGAIAGGILGRIFR